MCMYTFFKRFPFQRGIKNTRYERIRNSTKGLTYSRPNPFGTSNCCKYKLAIKLVNRATNDKREEGEISLSQGNEIQMASCPGRVASEISRVAACRRQSQRSVGEKLEVGGTRCKAWVEVVAAGLGWNVGVETFQRVPPPRECFCTRDARGNSPPFLSPCALETRLRIVGCLKAILLIVLPDTPVIFSLVSALEGLLLSLSFRSRGEENGGRKVFSGTDRWIVRRRRRVWFWLVWSSTVMEGEKF